MKYSNDIRKMAKRANQRMLELEKANIISPAYRQAQAILEMMGRRSGTAKGRRFSETGKGTENELRQLKKALENFLDAKTSTIRGTKKWQSDIYESANANYNLKGAGITPEQYSELWETLPDESDRMYYGSYYIEVLEAYQLKVDSGEIKRENELSITEMLRIIEGTSNYKKALSEIGLTIDDIMKSRKRLSNVK